MKLVIAILTFLFSSIALSQESEQDFDPHGISADIAAKYAIYAMASSNAYHKSDRKRFDIEIIGWRQVDLNGRATNNPTRARKSGLAYDIFEKEGSNEVIFSFRGTDSKKDYLFANLAVPPFSLQYVQAKREFEKYMETHKDKKITITGHSLGGGLALSMSVRYGVDAVVFDSSPRIFDGLGNKHLPATRIMIYEKGEILSVARKFWPKIFQVVPKSNIYKTTFDFDGNNKHRSDYLALGLLNLGATSDTSLLPVIEALSKK